MTDHGLDTAIGRHTGGITAKYNYDAYGKGLDFTNSTQSPTATSCLTSGGQFDPDLQLYNLQARYYNAANGRFNQIDPYSRINPAGRISMLRPDDRSITPTQAECMKLMCISISRLILLRMQVLEKPTAEKLANKRKRPDGVVEGNKINTDEVAYAMDVLMRIIWQNSILYLRNDLSKWKWTDKLRLILIA